MIQKLLITFCIAFYAMGVPILEINESHVFNPNWTPHVRIHEVWQLITNSSIGLLCLWLLWIKHQIVISAVLSILVTGGFIAAFLIKDLYGGSMKYLDGSEKTVLDINIGVLGFGLALILLVSVIMLELYRSKKTSL